MRIWLFMILAICMGCRPEHKSFEGTYALSARFKKEKLADGYRENLMMRIKDSTAYLYGTVRTGGIPIKYYEKNDTLYCPEIYKAYRKAGDTDFLILQHLDGKTEEFSKLDGLDSLIDMRGLNTEKMGKYLQANLIAGKYKLNGIAVEFKANGEVTGLPLFSQYSVTPRTGTSWRFDSQNIIRANDGNVYRYQIKNNDLILTKYLTYYDKWETYNVSEEQYTFKGM